MTDPQMQPQRGYFQFIPSGAPADAVPDRLKPGARAGNPLIDAVIASPPGEGGVQKGGDHLSRLLALRPKSGLDVGQRAVANELYRWALQGAAIVELANLITVSGGSDGLALKELRRRFAERPAFSEVTEALDHLLQAAYTCRSVWSMLSAALEIVVGEAPKLASAEVVALLSRYVGREIGDDFDWVPKLLALRPDAPEILAVLENRSFRPVLTIGERRDLSGQR